MRFFRGVLTRVVLALCLLAGVAVIEAAAAAPVVVEGNRRVDADTIRTYFTGEDQGKINQAIKDLYATGLFSDVRVTRAGGRLVVHVVENSVINRVAFEGNKKVKSEQLEAEIQSKNRGPYSPAIVQADVQRILEIYRRSGNGNAKVTTRTVDLPNGRLDVVFTVDEGSKTGVKSINFVGNNAYSESRLRRLMTTTEMNFLSWLKTTDVYDPEKIASDEELIRRFYLRHGYADFRIVGTDVRFEPGDDAGYVITITVEEGAPYTVSSVKIESRLPQVSSDELLNAVPISAGDTYDGDQVQKTVEALTREVARRGFAFSEVRPRGDRDTASHSVALNFVVDEGPRVYIERINVRGNTRTRDYVIRREFDIGEGDPYNKVLIDRAERRLNSLGFFKKVRITNEPGSSPDRVIINVDVEDQPTGSFAVSGGYSTTDGFIAELSVTESNFLGRGQFVKFAIQEGQHARGVDLSFTEPYIMNTRIAAGLDLFAKQTDNTAYTDYSTFVTGGTLRFGIPITDEFSISPHYSLYNTRISIPNTSSTPYNDCVYPIDGTTPGIGTLAGTATSLYNCQTNGEASLAIKQAAGSTLTSLAGFNLDYNTLDNRKDPTSGIFAELREDIAGLGGDSKFIRTTGDLRYYHPILDDFVGILHVQGGNITGYGSESQLRIADEFQLGPTLVRGFAPGGIGPRDITNPAAYKYNPLGGSNFVGASAELQFPIPGLPRDLGLRGAIFADAGTLFGYEGKTNFTPGGGACVAGNSPSTPIPYSPGTCITVQDSNTIRSSVGASILWASPLGPIRFDYAYALTKDRFDVTQAFRFSGGTSF